jgi:hypothetical protein
MTDEEHAALDLYLTFQAGPHHAHFSAELYRLISKADFTNRDKLAQVYPLHVRLYEEWMLTADPFDFYEKYSCERNYKPEEDDARLRDQT